MIVMAYSHQKKLTEKGSLLNEKGQLAHRGYSTSPILSFARSDMPFFRSLRTKEWDSYSFGNDEWQVSVTIADNGYMGLAAVSVVNLHKKQHKINFSAELFPLGRYHMPDINGFGDIVYRSRNSSVNITVGQSERRLTLRFPNFDDVKELYISAVFNQPKEDSLCAVIPFKNKNEFFCTRKIHCLPVSGVMRFAGIETAFEPDSTFGSYQCCRGLLPRKGEWISCSVSAMHENERFGLNIGSGFGDRTECGENAFFYCGVLFKLGELDITVPKDMCRDSWCFIGEDGDVNLRMVPVYSTEMTSRGMGFAKMEQIRVFGRYYGSVILRAADGSSERLVLNGILGYAEAVKVKW